MRTENRNALWSSQTVLTTVNSDPLDLRHMAGYIATASWTVSTPSNKTFADTDVTVGTDLVAVAAHGFTTGVKVTLTSSGTLPAGLALATDYFIISVTSGTIKFASSYANAIAGTAVDITAAAGGGTHTINVTALAGGAVKLQFTLDDPTDPAQTPTWVDVTSSSTNVTATGSTYWEKTDVFYPFARLSATLTAGLYTVTAKINAKGF